MFFTPFEKKLVSLIVNHPAVFGTFVLFVTLLLFIFITSPFTHKIKQLEEENARLRLELSIKIYSLEK